MNKHATSVFLSIAILFIVSVFLIRNQSSDEEGVLSNDRLKLSVIDQVDHYMTPPNKNDHYKIKEEENTITVVNYFSMDCIHCRKAYLFEEKLLAKYGDKVNLVYRHNPLPEIQPLSPEKALIAECVYNQGGDESMFRFMGDVYENFSLTNSDNSWIKRIAIDYVEDVSKLENCISDPKEKEKISMAKNKATASAVTRTPTIAIYEGTKLIERNDGMGANNIAKSLEYWLTR